jgi:hypothetical protein
VGVGYNGVRASTHECRVVGERKNGAGLPRFFGLFLGIECLLAILFYLRVTILSFTCHYRTAKCYFSSKIIQ